MDEGIFLFAERGKTLLKGKAYALLGKLISSGKQTEDELVEQLSGTAAPELLYYALNRLEKEGYIVTRSADLPEEVRRFCGLLSVSEEVAAERLQSTKVHLQNVGGPPEKELELLLDSLQIARSKRQADATLDVVLCDNYLNPVLSEINAYQVANKQPWLLAKPTGTQIWIGPLYRPKETGCHRCLLTRLEPNRLEEGYVKRVKGLDLFPTARQTALPAAHCAAWGLLAMQLLQVIVTGNSDHLDGKIYTLDLLTPETQAHVLTKQPHCPSCGKRGPRSVVPPQLQSRKVQSSQGGYHSATPEETFERYASQISPITGVINFVHRSEELGPNLHVYSGGSNWALPEDLQGSSFKSFRVGAGGKGTTAIGAKAGCLAEAIERKSGELHGDEPAIRAAFVDLGDEAIDPRTTLLYSKAQYGRRQTLNPTAHPFHRVSDPFPKETELSWAPVWSLTEGRVKYFPSDLAYFNKQREDEWNCRADSNGCAAGNCLEEAILQGFFELIERDAVAIWWYNRLSQPRIDIASFDDPYIENLIRTYSEMDREVWALDLTTDLGIPAVASLTRLRKGPKEEIFFGFGAHLDAKIALLRSLTEMNQFVSLLPFWEDPTTAKQPDVEITKEWLDTATLENQPYLIGGDARGATDYTRWESDDLLADIRHCQGIVEQKGMEMCILDQTREEIGLNVARVIVPGLRHFWPRYAPGRLYDVPVVMGHLEKPLQETDLNPIGIFI